MSRKYCICRSSEDKSFMILCEKCEEWFHGKCVGITKKTSKGIENYYCDACIKKDRSLKIEYKPDYAPKIQEKKPSTAKQQLQQQNQQQTSKSTVEKQTKIVAPVRRKAGPKAKSRNYSRKQCGNPDCCFEARNESSYCSDECGITFNKLRYDTFYLPKWNHLDKNHSKARLTRLQDWDSLEKERKLVISRINNLKVEKEELENTIKQIKEEAKRQCDSNPKGQPKNNEENDDEEMEVEDGEGVLTGDAGKSFCITCGSTIPSNQALRHWSSCHKKHEDIFNFTADIPIKYEYKETEDPNPKLYCNNQDKKTKRYCMNIEGACPLHSAWNFGKDEVCGCPLNMMQKLVPDGVYCTELKKDCTQHYHWDRFRMAQLNMQRVQAFTRLDVINDKIKYLGTVIEDSYGGVVGVMLHNTIDHEVDI